MTDWIAVCMEQYASEIPAEAWYDLPPKEPIAESVTFAGISNGKRNTEKQASLYDAMLAEIYAERDGEKAKVRNRRKNDRKHKLTPKMRKEQEELRNINICNRYIGWGWTLIDDKKTMEHERVARADYDAELFGNVEEMRRIAEMNSAINHAIAERDRILGRVYRHIESLKNHADKVAKMRNPHDWESMYEFENETDWLFDHAFPEYC